MLRSDLGGRTLGEFVLRECIDEGGFGAVYRAEQPLLGREAAVKVLHQRLHHNDTALQRFMREAQVASRLDHPYAAHVYAFGIEQDDGLCWIAMELVQGTALNRWLREKGPLRLDQLVPFFECVAEVVQTAHERNIVHRDLKPSNVMVIERAGKLLPKLLDFGVAKLLDEVALPRPPRLQTVGTQPLAGAASDRRFETSEAALTLTPSTTPTQRHDLQHRLTHADSTIGSPPYMSPEQWNNAATVDPASDLYGLAVIAYEALTGRRPFIASTVAEYADLHCNAVVPPLGERFSRALDRWFERALAKRPEQRWSSARELAAALREASGLDRGSPEDRAIQLADRLDRPLRFAVLSGPAVRITVYNAGGLKLGVGEGTIVLSLARGLYRVHLNRCGAVRELFVEHDQETLLHDSGPSLDTPAPLVGGMTSHDYYGETARRLSVMDTCRALGDGPHNARLFIFIRRKSDKVGPPRVPSEPVTIHDHSGRKLASLDRNTAQADDEIGYIAFSSQVRPGTYRIRAVHSRREIAITIPEGRAAHVFLADTGAVRVDDLRVSLVDLKRPFDPESDVSQALESVLAALRSPELAFPPDARLLLPNAVDQDLTFGIAAAHQLWRCGDTAAFEQVVGRLMKFTIVPDIAILCHLWRQAEITEQRAFAAPPLLRASLDMAMTRPEFDAAAIPLDGTFARATATAFHDSTWFTWSARAWEERWIEPTVECLRSIGHGNDAATIARTIGLPVLTVQRAFDAIDATSPLSTRSAAVNAAPRVSGYEIGEVIGRGARGVVFRATRMSDGRAIALKIAPLMGHQDQRANIEREIKMIQRLRHPALLAINHWGTTADDAGLWFDMELCRESMLDQLSSANAPQSTERACQIVTEVLAVIEYLHGKGIAHGNIAPSRFLVRANGRLAIAAPNLVKSLASASAPSVTHDIMRAEGFRPREQLVDTDHTTTASDVWSTAATLYFLLTLELPRDEHSDKNRTEVAVKDLVIPIADRRADVPEEIARCIDQALSEDIVARPSDGAALRKRLMMAIAARDPTIASITSEQSNHALCETTPGRADRQFAWRARVRRAPVLAAVSLAAAVFVVGMVLTHMTPRLTETLRSQCEAAASDQRDTAADLCLLDYELTRDSATGARAARALQDRDGALPIIEWIASAIGDSPAGADAWLAAGISRGRQEDLRGEIAAYLRAVANRAPSDTPGQLRDAVALLYYYHDQNDYQAMATQAALVYELIDHVAGQDDRAAGYLNIAALLIDVRNLGMAENALDRAHAVISPVSRYYAHLRQLEAQVEQGRGHPALARSALLEARALAIRDGDRRLEFNARMNLIHTALRDGPLDDASTFLAFQPPGPDALPSDRTVDAYYRAWLALVRGNPRVAAQLLERALRQAPETWIAQLEDLHGRALAQAGEAAGAERALVRAVEAIEHKRDALEADTFKSWLLADLREPFEDLFLLYVSGNRLEDALAVIQRATARSTLDELIEVDPLPETGIAAVGMRSESMRKLARALRSSPASVVPPIDMVLARLRGNHVITYFRARRALWALAVARDGSLHARKIGDASALGAQVAAWRRRPEDVAIADELGTTLLPDDLMPPSQAPLFIVADDPIAEVSFAALRRHGELVLDHHAAAYAPSAAVLSAMRRSPSPRRALVLGDPTGDLPQARAEAEEVAARLQVTPRLGQDAARAAVLDAGRATVIHIAAHTVPTPFGAALRLADGLLDANALIDHGVAAGALVLLTSRDALTPLAAAFVAAGACTVIASRWAVPDDIGRQFARMFYQDNGLVDPIQAVASAQRRLVAQHVPVEQWSTFVIVGGLS